MSEWNNHLLHRAVQTAPGLHSNQPQPLLYLRSLLISAQTHNSTPGLAGKGQLHVLFHLFHFLSFVWARWIFYTHGRLLTLYSAETCKRWRYFTFESLQVWVLSPFFLSTRLSTHTNLCGYARICLLSITIKADRWVKPPLVVLMSGGAVRVVIKSRQFDAFWSRDKVNINDKLRCSDARPSSLLVFGHCWLAGGTLPGYPVPF